MVLQHTVSAGGEVGDSGSGTSDIGGGPNGSGDRRRSACRLRNSKNSSFMARTRASTSSRDGRALGRSGVEGVGVRVARSHS